jgi:hypothetical protein
VRAAEPVQQPGWAARQERAADPRVDPTAADTRDDRGAEADRAPVAPVAAPAATADSLAAEARALEDVQQALRNGDVERALALLDEQDARYRTGTLEEERAAARVLALCQGGLSGRARDAAARFERRWPRSTLMARVRSACRAP